MMGDSDKVLYTSSPNHSQDNLSQHYSTHDVIVALIYCKL